MKAPEVPSPEVPSPEVLLKVGVKVFSFELVQHGARNRIPFLLRQETNFPPCHKTTSHAG